MEIDRNCVTTARALLLCSVGYNLFIFIYSQDESTFYTITLFLPHKYQ